MPKTRNSHQDSVDKSSWFYGIFKGHGLLLLCQLTGSIIFKLSRPLNC